MHIGACVTMSDVFWCNVVNCPAGGVLLSGMSMLGLKQHSASVTSQSDIHINPTECCNVTMYSLFFIIIVLYSCYIYNNSCNAACIHLFIEQKWYLVRYCCWCQTGWSEYFKNFWFTGIFPQNHLYSLQRMVWKGEKELSAMLMAEVRGQTALSW